MTATAAERVMQRLNPAPYFEHLGARLVDAGEGTATVRIPSRPEFGRSQNTGGRYGPRGRRRLGDRYGRQLRADHAPWGR
jgi:hypothetical protein